MDDEAGDPINGHYNDSNRAFIQAFLARGTLSIVEGKKLLAAIFTAQDEDRPTAPEDVTQEDFDSYIAAAADAISPFDYEIRRTQNQVTKEQVYALVNSNSDPLTQLATNRTTEEILYLKRFLDGMFDTFNTPRREVMAITGLQAVEGRFRRGAGRQSGANNTQSIDKGVTQEQIEKLLASLIREKWLERSKNGFYRLAPRGLMELRSWLVDTYNDSEDPEEWQPIKFCEACKEIITVGQRCADLACNIRLHDICANAYWNSKPTKKCPKCRTTWDGKKFVGEKAVTTTEDYLKGKRRSGISKRSRPDGDESMAEVGPSNRRSGRPPSQDENEEDAEEDEDEDEDEDES